MWELEVVLKSLGLVLTEEFHPGFVVPVASLKLPTPEPTRHQGE